MDNPAKIRTIFGENLRLLAQDHSSITILASKLGINRTQFNRYLSGESFPRPDILARICAFFDLDARILLEPLADIAPAPSLGPGAYLNDFLGSSTQGISKNTFPSGFYRFSRRSFIDSSIFVVGLVYVFRDGDVAYLRGYETVEAMRMQSLPTAAPFREFRGIILQQEEGIAIIAARKNAMTSSFNYLSRAASFANNFWVGYIARTIPEDASGLGAVRVTRLVYEHLTQDAATVLQASRTKGFYTIDELAPFHRRLLRTDQGFA